MKKIAILVLVITSLLFTNVFSKPTYMTPQKENITLYKSYTGKTTVSGKVELGHVYDAGEMKKERVMIPELNAWVNKKDVTIEMSKSIIEYKAEYLSKYKTDQDNEIERRKAIVNENPSWSKTDKKAVTDGIINPNWPMELVLASWGEPSKRLNFVNKEGVKEVRLLYGQKLLIFENDSLKYEKMHYSTNLNVHLDKKKDIVDSTASNRNDSTLAE